MEQETKIIKIDPWSIVKIILVILGILVVYYLRDIILIIIAALFLAAIISPVVDKLQKKKIPRWAGASIIYLIVILIFVGIFFSIGPIVKAEGQLFLKNIPEFLQPFFTVSPGEEWPLTDWLKERSESVTSFLSNVVGMVFSLIMTFTIAFYITVEKKAVKQLVPTIIPVKYRHFVNKFLASSQDKVGAWGRGMIVLCLTVGILTYIGLSILGIRFALVLALIAAVTELVPWIGPWLGGIPAFIVGLAISPLTGLWVAILYIVVQQIENSFIVPYVMKRAVGLNPLVTIIVLLIGGKVAGFWGMVLAVPIATVLSILFQEYMKFREEIRKEIKPADVSKE